MPELWATKSSSLCNVSAKNLRYCFQKYCWSKNIEFDWMRLHFSLYLVNCNFPGYVVFEESCNTISIFILHQFQTKSNDNILQESCRTPILGNFWPFLVISQKLLALLSTTSHGPMTPFWVSEKNSWANSKKKLPVKRKGRIAEGRTDSNECKYWKKIKTIHSFLFERLLIKKSL